MALDRRGQASRIDGIRPILIAILAVAAAVAVRVLLDDYLGNVPFILFVLPVMFAATYEGFRAGISATGASLLVAWYLFVPPRHTLVKGTPEDIARAVVFAIGGAAISLISDRLLRSRVEAQASEERFRGIFENAAVGMGHRSLEGQWVRVNQRLCDILDCTPDEMLAPGFRDPTHSDDRGAERTNVHALLAGAVRSYSLEKRFYRKDGGTVWANVTVSLQRDDQGAPESFIAVVEDITERKRAEQALREAHEQFETVITASPAPIVALTRDGLISIWNPAAERVFGWTAAEVMGQLLPFIPAEKWQEHREMRERDLLGQSFTDHEIIRRRKDGRPIHLTVSTAPLRDSSSEVTGIMSVYADVTERRRMEYELRESEAKFRALVEQSPMATVVIAMDGRVVRANKAWERLYGVTAAELGSRDAFEDPQLEALGMRPYLLRARAGEELEMPEVAVILERGERAGEKVWLRTAAYPVRDEEDRVREVVLVQEDVTEAYRAQEALRRTEQDLRLSQERLDIAVQAHLIGIFDWDIQTGQVMWTEQEARLFGVARDSFEGTIEGWQRLVIPEDATRLGEDFAAAWKEQATTCSFWFRIPRPGGETRFVEGSGRFVYADNGTPLRMVGVNIDVTERKQAEEELKKVNAELEQFAYVASHDLQEPLRMVNIYTELLLRRSLADDKEAQDFGAVVRQGVHRMDDLIRDLLSYSRSVYRDGMAAGRAPLVAAVTEALRMLDSRIRETGAEITSSPLPVVAGDASQYALVFQNLLSNSLKYRSANIAPRIEIAAVEKAEHWVISVQDNGIGFDQKYAERIFGLFKRLHKDEYPGTGLGLAICQRVVERYGGRMWAEGRPGEGATFFVELPKAEAPMTSTAVIDANGRREEGENFGAHSPQST